MSVVGQVVTLLAQAETVRVALNAFCEGRRLEGQWALRITGVELVPVDPPEKK